MTRRLRRVRLAILLANALALAGPGCSSSGGGGDADTDADVDADADADTDADTDTDAPRTLVWSDQIEIDLDEAGLQLQLAASPDDRFGVAYYKRGVEGDVCTVPILGDSEVPVQKDTVRYAEFDLAAQTWSAPEDVNTEVENVFLAGVSLVFDTASSPLVAYLGGAESQQCCGGSDLIVARRTGPGAWSNDAAATDSGQAAAGADCPKMQNICDVGDFVGMWPFLARAPDGTIGAAYRDIHLCYAKDDQDASDLEWAFQPGGAGGWQHEWIDLARAAGSFNRLAFGPDGAAAVAHYNGKYQMINFGARGEDGTWTPSPDCVPGDVECPENMECVEFRCSAMVHERFAEPLPEQSLSLAIGPDGRYLVAYFDGDERKLRLAHSTDGLVWERGLIDTDGLIGMYPSLYIDPVTGKPAVAYYRCDDQGSGPLDCNRNVDGVHFAYFKGEYPAELTTLNKWVRSVVSEDAVATDGTPLSAAALSDGTVGVAYSYSYWDPGEERGRQHLMFRLGTWE